MIDEMDSSLGVPKQINVDLLANELRHMRQDLAGQKAILSKLSDSFEALTRVEERLAAANHLTNLLHNDYKEQNKRIDAFEAATVARFSAIENKLPAFSQTAMWVERAVIALVAIVGTYVAKQTGLIP